ncbi:MAG: hypothetical protein R3C19_08340 [Planctomycetaceae bacterium]
MDSENPYLVSSECAGDVAELPDFSEPTEFMIVGDLLVCGPELDLPAVCVMTGATESLASVWEATQLPSFKVTVIPRQCHVRYYLSEGLSRRRSRYVWLLCATLLLALTMLAGAHLRLTTLNPIFMAVMMILVVASLILLHRSSVSLQVIRFEAPGRYWIRGFPPEYLQRIAPWARH